MTEAEWLECASLSSLKQYMMKRYHIGRPGSGVSDRRLRLFACACCRRIWPLLKDGRIWTAIEIAERYADGLATRKELRGARLAASAAVELRSASGAWLGEDLGARAAVFCAAFNGIEGGWKASRDTAVQVACNLHFGPNNEPRGPSSDWHAAIEAEHRGQI